jgi:hypothetical protein
MTEKSCSASEYRKEMAKYTEMPLKTGRVTKKKNETDQSRLNLDSIETELLRKILEMVKQKPMIWDKRNQQYANTKNNCWKEIDQKIQTELDKLIEEGTLEDDSNFCDGINSRHIYNALVKKYKREEAKLKRQPSGSSPCKSNWTLYEEMKFASAASDDSSL